MTTNTIERDLDKRQINVLKSQLQNVKGSIRKYKVWAVVASLTALGLAASSYLS